MSRGIVRVYFDTDQSDTGLGSHEMMYKSVHVLPEMTASEVRDKIGKKLLYGDGQVQKFALIMVDKVPVGVRQRRRARTLARSEKPAQLQSAKMAKYLAYKSARQSMSSSDGATAKSEGEENGDDDTTSAETVEPVKFLLKNLGSPLDLGPEYCGSSADEEEDDVEAPYLLPRVVDDATLRGYLYKRGVEDELVWYKRWCVLYDGCLWYWKSQTLEKDPVRISLTNAVVRLSPMAKKNRHMRFAFELETPKRVYDFRAMTESHFVIWMKTLQAGVMFAQEDSQMQLAEHFIRDHATLRAKVDYERIKAATKDLRSTLNNKTSYECLVEYMGQSQKEELVLFWADVVSFEARVNTLLSKFPPSGTERQAQYGTWMAGVAQAWEMAYAIYEHYIDNKEGSQERDEVFSLQPRLHRVSLEVHKEPPPADMFSYVQKAVFQKIDEGCFREFQQNSEYLKIMSAAILSKRRHEMESTSPI